MIIKKADIEGFGKFSGRSLDFQPGFNLITGNNEDGKTTLMSFIKMMFYSSSSKTEKGQDLSKSLRKKYRPWDGSPMSGAVEFEFDNKEWRLHKNFLKSDATDKTTVFCKTTGEEEKIQNPNDAGEYFFNMNSGEFERSVFIGTTGGFSADASGDSLAMRISNLSVSGDENISQEIVVKRLSDALEELISKSGKKGLLVECEARLAELKLKAQQLEIQAGQQKELFEEISQIESEIADKEKVLKAVSDSNHSAIAKKELNAFYTLNNKLNLSQNINKQLAVYNKTTEELKQHIRTAEEITEKISEVSQKIENTSLDQTERISDSILAQAEKVEEDVSKIRHSIEVLRTRITNLKTELDVKINKAKNRSKTTALTIGAVLILAGLAFLGLGVAKKLPPSLISGIILLLSGIISGVILYLFLPRKAYDSFQVQLAKRDYDTALRNIDCFEDEMLSMSIFDIEKKLNSTLSDRIDILNEILQQHNCTSIDELKGKTPLSYNENLIALQGQLSQYKETFIFHMSKLKTVDTFVAAKILFNEVADSIKTLENILKDIDTICITAGISDSSEEFVTSQIKELTELLQNLSETDAVPDINKDEYEESLRILRKRLGELQSRIQLPELSETELNELISDSQNESQKLKARYEELSIAASVMNEAVSETNKGLGSFLSKKMGEYLSVITNGKYSDVLVPRNLSVETRSGEGSAFREWKYLSSGAIDKVYLALRLAATDVLVQDTEALPLFLDDIFVQYDNDSCKTALSFLKEYLQKEHSASQILFFTCHRHIADLAKGIFDNINEITL